MTHSDLVARLRDLAAASNERPKALIEEAADAIEKADRLAGAAEVTVNMVASYAMARFGWPDGETWKIAATKDHRDPQWSEDDRAYIRLCTAIAVFRGIVPE